MKSLKNKLQLLIRERGEISYGDMAQFVVEEGYKISTAERRLRGLMADKNEQGEWQTPEIFPIMKKSKRNTDYIAGYRYGKPLELKKPAFVHEGNKVIMIV